jgi:hypothetical protein
MIIPGGAMEKTKFTQKYRDLSTDSGFQFEFLCDRCGKAHVSDLQPVKGDESYLWTDNVKISPSMGLGTADAGSSMPTGSASHFMNAAKDRLREEIGSEKRAHSAAWLKKHAAAFRRAVRNAKHHFHQCKGCGQWVGEDCWEQERGLCKDCAAS